MTKKQGSENSVAKSAQEGDSKEGGQETGGPGGRRTEAGASSSPAVPREGEKEGGEGQREEGEGYGCTEIKRYVVT